MSYFNEHKVSKNSQQTVQLGREGKQTDKLDNEKVVAKIHIFPELINTVLFSEQDCRGLQTTMQHTSIALK